jgi:hypothetical protein
MPWSKGGIKVIARQPDTLHADRASTQYPLNCVQVLSLVSQIILIHRPFLLRRGLVTSTAVDELVGRAVPTLPGAYPMLQGKANRGALLTRQVGFSW